MKKIALLVASVLVVALIGTYIYFSGKEYLVIISEKEIREKLNATLPLKKLYLFVFEITLDNPRVDLVEASNRINAGFDVVLNIKIGSESKPIGGTIDASGALKYVPAEGAFYLVDPIIENLSFQGLSETYAKKVSNAAEKALVNFYSDHPLYILKASDVKQAAAKLILKNLVIRNEAIEVTLGI